MYFVPQKESDYGPADSVIRVGTHLSANAQAYRKQMPVGPSSRAGDVHGSAFLEVQRRAAGS